eukprot:TRINITY_DN4339_c0_g1_i3.p1 TRINITY_DN4339_c0_g1~~TRINITY_DN4339_c0_g1_i3.p1  ORF type:complete len:765 (+),score=140.45 TRINITY_DN4339_c0_g1_i3:42-2336(+)
MSQETWTLVHAVELCVLLHQPLSKLPTQPKHFEDESQTSLWKIILEQTELLRSGKYEDVWKVIGAFDPRLPAQDEMSLKIIANRLEFKLSGYLEGPEELERSPFKKDLFLLRFCSAMISIVAMVYIYTQTNYTGPDYVAEEETTKCYAKTDELLEELSVDGERSFLFTRFPNLLFGVRTLLESLSTTPVIRQSIAYNWWTGRAAILNMQIFEEIAPSLHEIALSNLSNTLIKLSQVAKASTSALLAQYIPSGEQSEISKPTKLGDLAGFSELISRIHIEIGLLHRNNFSPDQAMKFYTEARKARGVELEMTGIKGIRMRYQSFQVSQLVLKARATQEGHDGQGLAPQEQPLDHPDLLPQPKLEETNEEATLHPIDQSIIICLCLDVKSRNPQDVLTNEEMMPYVRRVMMHPNNWIVYSTALLVKSRLESKKTKTIERAVLQLQALVDQHNDTDVSGYDRMRYIFSLPYPSKWELKRELGHAFLNLGVARSALQQFEEYHMWTEVVQCYRVMEQTRKAEEIVRKQLEVRPTPELWCVLGELIDDENCFEKAWELSGQRYSKSQRCWARYLLRRGKYEECIPHFELALKINPMFPMTWFSLGCAAMRVGEYEKAANAFTRVVHQEPEDGEAWCNLGSVYVSQKKLTEAWHALREALKHKRQSWKIWQNFMYISIDIEEFSQAVYAYDNILELRDKEGVDAPVLNILATVAVEYHESKKENRERYIQSVLTLFGKVCSKVRFSHLFVRTRMCIWPRPGFCQDSWNQL